MIDTNVLLDWLLDRDAERTKRVDRLFKEHKDLQLPDVIIVDLAYALEKVYRLPRNLVAENVSRIIDESALNCNRVLFRRMLSDYTAHPALSFVDCCLLRYAELQHAKPIWTFDQKLVHQSDGRAELLL